MFWQAAKGCLSALKKNCKAVFNGDSLPCPTSHYILAASYSPTSHYLPVATTYHGRIYIFLL